MGRALAGLPSVDEVLRTDRGRGCVARFGHTQTVAMVRARLDALRAGLRDGPAPDRAEAAAQVAQEAEAALMARDATRMVRVFNLTGTVLHTNLGRALYAPEAVEAANRAMRYPLALEYDLETGRRGQRDDAVCALVAELTGAEDACLVNNNASAVLLVLAALGAGRETVVSRGELIEIGGSFRMPAIMEAAGTRLREVGTTNRTHLKDYRAAIGPQTALLMKVHTSNYRVQGFTRETTVAELAPLAREAGLPLIDDLGSGTLVDLSQWGLARERTVQDALGEGADLVTFSGDKLLGGPQAGFITGRRDLVRACASHPIKRAVRLDKVRLAALEATLKLYRDPDRLAERLPTLAAFARPLAELRALAGALAPRLAEALGRAVEIVDTSSQIGSGALPLETIPSVALRLPAPGGEADRLAAAFRRLPIPVIGRVEGGALLFDLRCLDDAEAFLGQLGALEAGPC
ncbi:MAG: L-seryl-tRNA(Sec) selenium transferase [Roseovarius sp.]|nr:L-seryl-tRNA(Sec) selenium transferase [Roseovarius sp.]